MRLVILFCFFIFVQCSDSEEIDYKKLDKQYGNKTWQDWYELVDVNAPDSLSVTNDDIGGSMLLCNNVKPEKVINYEYIINNWNGPFTFNSLFIKFNSPYYAFVSGDKEKTATISFDATIPQNFYDNIEFTEKTVNYSHPIMISSKKPCKDFFNVNSKCAIPDPIFISALPEYVTTSTGIFINLPANLILSEPKYDPESLNGYSIQIDRKSLDAYVFYEHFPLGKINRSSGIDDPYAFFKCQIVDEDLTENYKLGYQEFQRKIDEAFQNKDEKEKTKGSDNKI